MANIVYCRFCGRAISAVRSNAYPNAAAVTAYHLQMVDWVQTPAPSVGTYFGQGMVDHSTTCPGRSKWYRKAGGPAYIPTIPSNLGSI